MVLWDWAGLVSSSRAIPSRSRPGDCYPNGMVASPHRGNNLITLYYRGIHPALPQHNYFNLSCLFFNIYIFQHTSSTCTGITLLPWYFYRYRYRRSASPHISQKKYCTNSEQQQHTPNPAAVAVTAPASPGIPSPLTAPSLSLPAT